MQEPVVCTGMHSLRPGRLTQAIQQQMASELKVENDDFRHKNNGYPPLP